MSDKVLKINIVVDENGEARRSLDEVDKSIHKVEGSANSVKAPLDRTAGSLDKASHSADGAAHSAQAVGMSFSRAIPYIGGLSVASVSYTAAATAVTAAMVAQGAIILRSSQYYIEQSGVLEVNRGAMDQLADSAKDLAFVIGQEVVGTEGDFTRWINAATTGLILMGTKFAANIALAKEMVNSLPGVSTGLNLLDAAFGEGGDTRRRGLDGKVTDYGMKQIMAATTELKTLSRTNQEWREVVERVTPAAVQAVERYETELQRAREVQKQLAEDLFQVRDAARQAFDHEIANAFMENLRGVKSATEGIRDNFAAIVLSGSQLKEFRINEDTNRAIADIDPRAENAGALTRQLEAQRQAQMLLLKKETSGMTDELAQELLIFQETYRDVIGDLPATLQGIVPEIADASGQIRDTMTGDLASIESAAQRTFNTITVLAKSSADLMREAQMAEFDAERNQQRGDPLGIGWWQRQSAADKRRLAGQAQFREGMLGFARGGVVGVHGDPLYFSGGGFIPRGTDTVPAMLTPGEGVINTRGMAALERLNSGHVGTVNVTIDARGAVFQDDDAIDRLANKVQRKLQEVSGRIG